MNKIQAKNMLDMVVEHFSKAPTKLRAIKNNEWQCQYSCIKDKPKSIGCAIGMFISDAKLCQKMDRAPDPAIKSILNSSLGKQLPKWMQKMDSWFLQDIQDLHDDDHHWTKDGLSKKGVEKVKQITKKYC